MKPYKLRRLYGWIIFYLKTLCGLHSVNVNTWGESVIVYFIYYTAMQFAGKHWIIEVQYKGKCLVRNTRGCWREIYQVTIAAFLFNKFRKLWKLWVRLLAFQFRTRDLLHIKRENWLTPTEFPQILFQPFNAQSSFKNGLFKKLGSCVRAKTYHVRIIIVSRLMIFRETIAVYCGNKTKHRSTLCGRISNLFGR